MPETRTTFCRICEALCGLEITLEEGEITQIRPDQSHVATQGFGCAKGLKQHRLFSSPDRLKFPMKKTEEGHVRVSWDEAIGDIGARIKKIVAEDGPDAVAMYVGTAAGFSVLHPVFAQGYMQGLGSRSFFASSTQDCSNKFAVATEMYGFPFTQPFPDVDHTDCLIVVGANPVISKWSFLQVSNPARRLKQIEGRGGKVFFIDPRRTESAKVAGEHIFIRPNTDVYFYLSFLQELFAIGGVDADKAALHMSGMEEVKALVKPWTPEKTEAVTGIPADTLRHLVRCYHEADGAALYCSTGVNMGTHGSVSFWLQECINALSGNLDRKGGTLVGQGVMDFPKFGKKNGILLNDTRSRIGDFSAVNDALPGGILADEILTPGKGQIKALIVTGGNPLLTMANSERLREAFSHLELLVILDILPNETGTLAHYQLPCVSPLQRPDLPFIFPMMLGLQTKPYMQATKAILPPEGEQRDEASIYLDLCKASGVSLFGSRIAQTLLQWNMALHSRKHPERPPSLSQEGILSLILRLTGQGSFKKLLQSPHGRLLEEHKGSDYLADRVVTDDGKVHLAPAALLQEAEALEDDFAKELKAPQGFRLITKRAVTTHNSWTHNLEEFVSGQRVTNYLYMHSKDAESIGVSVDDFVDVTSKTATVRLPVKVLDDLMPGTVALPHGWGHQHAKGLSVASQTRGVNVNILAADGPENLERLSGMAHLTGIPVEVKPAAGPQYTHDWSGLSPEEKQSLRSEQS